MIKRNFLPHSYSADSGLLRLGQAKQENLGGVIRCLVWNIWKARRTGWLDDFAHLCGDRDLVLLQEAVSNAPSDALFARSQRFEWIMARSHRHPRTGIETGVKTGCVAQSQLQQAFVSPHSEPIVNTQKMLLRTCYKLPNGDTLMVLNMHAINFVSVRKYTKQLNQLASVLSRHAGPIILAGDFNTWNLQRYSRFSELAAEADLHEANMLRGRRLAHMNQHLDHVFYRGLVLRDIESLCHVRSSDHAPITVTFEQENT